VTRPVRFGRQPRKHDTRIPHMSALLAGKASPPPPPSADYTVGMPADLGIMLNGTLGDCTCAALFHALQVWTFNAAAAMVTPPDSDVLALYEAACGYNPADPSTDQGGDEQAVLAYALNTGLQTDAGMHRLAAYVEIDPKNTDDVRRAIAACGLVYIGFDVPQYLADYLTAPNSVWDLWHKADNSIAGGHAVILAGYTSSGVRVISWGNYYTMTWDFFARRVDEVYALADADWIKATGLSPGGLSLAALKAQMLALKAEGT
jgi:hypothetical protein